MKRKQVVQPLVGIYPRELYQPLIEIYLHEEPIFLT